MQINEVTSYIDGSQVYGSDEGRANSLRNPVANLGLLLVEPFINSGGEFILPAAGEEDFCRSPDPENKPCFFAGDIRVNENQGMRHSWTFTLDLIKVHLTPQFFFSLN